MVGVRKWAFWVSIGVYGAYIFQRVFGSEFFSVKWQVDSYEGSILFFISRGEDKICPQQIRPPESESK